MATAIVDDPFIFAAAAVVAVRSTYVNRKWSKVDVNGRI